jgi:glucosamine kinase
MTVQRPHIIVGVDGGGTGCRAAVGTFEDGILALATGGPGNVESDFDGAITAIRACVGEALAKAGLGNMSPVQIIAHIGVAGTNEGPLVAQTKAALPYGQTHVTGDRATTVRGVLGKQDGYVVALGTGTIIARQKDQQMTSVGGWGFHVSDQASGAWLGRKLLEQTVLADDGITPHTPLTQKMVEQFGPAPDIFMFTSRARPKDYAALAPDIISNAAEGEPTALTLVQDGAAYIQAALETLGYTAGKTLCFSGGLGPHYAPRLDTRFTQNVMKPQGTALDGAFALACDAACTFLPVG